MSEQRTARFEQLFYMGIQRSDQSRRILQHLDMLLSRISRPKKGELDADDYDGTLPIRQWLNGKASTDD